MKRNFGISQNVKSRLVCTCTPELFREAVDSAAVASLCAEIADALEAVKRGELSREEFDILKADRKRLLPVITPHATFTAGRRVNAEAVPSGLCMLDADHLPDARGFYEANVRGREEALGILLAHITPSCEGLRLVFVLPDPSMELEAAQRWMAGRLGMKEYDGAVKDLARCSFLVPRDYFLYLNEEGLFGEADAPQQAGRSTAEDKPSETPSSATTIHKQTESPNLQNENELKEKELKENTINENTINENTIKEKGESEQDEYKQDEYKQGENTIKENELKREEKSKSEQDEYRQGEYRQGENELKENELKENALNEKEQEACFKGIPYSEIISQWFALTGGEPMKGERNTRLHRLACHLRYITDNDETLLLRLMPRYGLTEHEMQGLIHSACTSKFCSTPQEMKKAIEIAKALLAASAESVAPTASVASVAPADYHTVTTHSADAASENQPTFGNQSVSENQPSTGNQSASENQPASGIQPSTEPQPATGNQSAPEPQPATGNQSISGIQPASEPQPSTGNQSVSENQSTSGIQPAPEPQPTPNTDAAGSTENEGKPAGASIQAAMNNAADSIVPPVMPKHLPPLIELLLSGSPDVYRPAVAHAVFPSLGAHLHDTRFRYIDNVCHEATLMNVLMAGTGAGKNCITEPINRIMADIRLRDEENLRREREWKEEVTSKGANKDKRKRPEGLVIQEIDADMTNPAFVMRTAEADGHFLYTKMNEIDQFDALRGSASSQQQFQIMCLAFDPGNRYGQTRVGTSSITEKVCIRFNWNASTTVEKGKRYFSRVLTDGPVSRINFCTIPEREIGAEMPVYGSFGPDFNEKLQPYIEHLCRAKGEIFCPEATRLALELREECAHWARLTQSRVYENLSFRALVIAWLKGCVLYVASGCRWDPTFDDFVRWSLQYDLWCKMEFFGAAIEEANRRSEQTASASRVGRHNLLNLLPEMFTLQDAISMRVSEGLSADGTQTMLRQWKFRGYVTIEMVDRSGRLTEVYCKNNF